MIFKVRTKVIVTRLPGKPPQSKAMSTWMETEKEYPVFDIMKYREKKEDGGYKINTLFLICDEKSGRMDWVDASILLYIGDKTLTEVGEGNNEDSIVVPF
jgi:hypothetical protein